ncbi:ABC transporter permease [Fundicoccus culcitae]|uniref:ABC transporter permease n=1 Tax=Fundicoccus culcitae TaxID=2969821 RepID=A0ABY5P2Q3_9LACT|nr:ABC transporter permease [Fundicoccus culcitae]UUX33007.1 ABC transporter permease [Fundicoccus culcitae]
MRRFIYKLFSTLFTLLLVSLIIFLIFNILPGNPAQAILGPDADIQQIRVLEEQLGLNDPLHTRYFNWIGGIFQGDFGTSYRYREPVAQIIADRLPVTLSLTIYSLLLTIIIAIPVGIFISRYEGTVISTIANLISQLGISIPSFWLAFVLILIFAVNLGWLPTFGYKSLSDGIGDHLRSMVLPSVSIAISNIAVIIRYLSNSVADQMNRDYVTTAIVKGADENRVLYRHVLKNASLPVITIFGLMVADTLGGSIIIENVFALPGIGSLLNSSVQTRDFPLIQSLVLFISIIIILANFVVDILYQVIDPRIKTGGK